MALLLTEEGKLLTTEDGNHLLIEPVTIPIITSFPSRFMGVAVIYDKGPFWEINLGRGPVKSKFANQLEQMARNAGASSVIYK